MGLHFNKLTLHNFGSYGHTEVDLQNRGFCLVSGENNYPKDNALSNGAGKSFLWSAICFALTGMTISGLHTNLQNINISENLCYVELDFAFGGSNYLINRSIAPKSDLKIVKDGIDVSGKGIKESSKKLEEYLPDITYDLIASTIILGQGLPQKFSSFTPSGRKELLEKLTKSDFMIEDIKTRVSNRLNILNNKVRDCEDRLLINKTQVDNLVKTQGDLQTELDTVAKIDYSAVIKDLDQALGSTNAEINRINAEIAVYEPQVSTLNTQLASKLSEKATVSEEELSKYKQALTEQLQAKSDISSALKVKESELKKLQSITDICPTCGQKIPQVIKPDTTQHVAEIKTLNESLKTASSKVDEIEAKHKQYMVDINNAFSKDIQDINEKLAELSKKLSDFKTQIASLNSKKTQISVELSLKIKENEALVTTVNNIKSKITANNAAITNAKANITELEAGLIELNEHLAVVKKIDTLIKRDFRGYLLSNIIEYLDARAKQYCKVVFDTTDLSIFLDGNNLNITYCDRLLDNLSGGERTRVDLVLQLSIRDLLCKYFGYTSNILVLDEVTDFLDAKSCEAVMNLISNQLKDIESVFIISHHAESLELPIDSELKVVKSVDGISDIIK